MNTYGYVQASPLKWGDPLGLRPLTDREKDLLSPYIPQDDLNNADVRVGKMPWYVPSKFNGITRGNKIYFRNPRQTFCTPGDIALLGHELVHVGQYRVGMTGVRYILSNRRGYDNNPYEIPAYEQQRRIQSELSQEDCACE